MLFLCLTGYQWVHHGDSQSPLLTTGQKWQLFGLVLQKLLDIWLDTGVVHKYNSLLVTFG